MNGDRGTGKWGYRWLVLVPAAVAGFVAAGRAELDSPGMLWLLLGLFVLVFLLTLASSALSDAGGLAKTSGLDGSPEPQQGNHEAVFENV